MFEVGKEYRVKGSTGTGTVIMKENDGTFWATRQGTKDMALRYEADGKCRLNSWDGLIPPKPPVEADEVSEAVVKAYICGPNGCGPNETEFKGRIAAAITAWRDEQEDA